MWYLSCLVAVFWILVGLNDPCLSWSVLFLFHTSPYMWYAFVVVACVCLSVFIGMISIYILLVRRQHTNVTTIDCPNTYIATNNNTMTLNHRGGYLHQIMSVESSELHTRHHNHRDTNIYNYCGKYYYRTKDWPIDIIISGVCFGIGYLFCGHTIQSAIITALLPANYMLRGDNVWILIACMWVGMCSVGVFPQERKVTSALPPNNQGKYNKNSIHQDCTFISSVPDDEYVMSDRNSGCLLSSSQISRFVRIFFVYSICSFLLWHLGYWFKLIQRDDTSTHMLSRVVPLSLYPKISSSTFTLLSTYCPDREITPPTTTRSSFTLYSLSLILELWRHQFNSSYQSNTPSVSESLPMANSGRSVQFIIFIIVVLLLLCCAGIVFSMFKAKYILKLHRNFTNNNSQNNCIHTLILTTHSTDVELVRHILQYAHFATLWIFTSMWAYYSQFQTWFISCLLLSRQQMNDSDTASTNHSSTILTNRNNRCEYSDNNNNAVCSSSNKKSCHYHHVLSTYDDILFGYIIGIYGLILFQFTVSVLLQLYADNSGGNIYEFIYPYVWNAFVSLSMMFIPVWEYPWQIQFLQMIGALLIGISTALWDRSTLVKSVEEVDILAPITTNCITRLKSTNTSTNERVVIRDTQSHECLRCALAKDVVIQAPKKHTLSEYGIWFGAMLLSVTAVVASQIK